MRRSLPIVVLCLFAFPARVVAAPSAEEVQKLIRARPELDQIRWKDPARGAPLNVRIVQADSRGVTVEKTLPAGLTTRAIPFGELASLSFRFTSREAALHRTPSAADAPALRVYWESRRATLRLPDSNAGDTGLALAKSLRLSGDPTSFDEAEKILGEIRVQDGSPSRVSRARSELSTLSFLRAVRGGVSPEADTAAWQITEDPDNEDGMLLATAYLAERHFSELKATDEANPRWMDDDEIRPLRQRLHHLSLDFALYPSLFLSTRSEESANGLRIAAQIHQYVGAPLLAKNTLEDLAALYPDTVAARDTAAELAKLKAREAAGKLSSSPDPVTEEETSDESETEALPAPPPPPKRYNIFGD